MDLILLKIFYDYFLNRGVILCGKGFRQVL